MKKKITIGILAHVDAGKTTLSEALLAAGYQLSDGAAGSNTQILTKAAAAAQVSEEMN